MERKELLPGYDLILDPDQNMLESGAWLVQEVSRLTGFPDPASWPDNTLYEHTRERHTRSMMRMIVTTQDEPEKPVAHALLLRPKEDPWTSWKRTRELYEQNRLAESGATAVHPDHQRRGIARAMQKVRWEYSRLQDWRICASTWVGGNSVNLYQGDDRWILLGEKIAPLTKRAALYWVEAEQI